MSKSDLEFGIKFYRVFQIVTAICGVILAPVLVTAKDMPRLYAILSGIGVAIASLAVIVRSEMEIKKIGRAIDDPREAQRQAVEERKAKENDWAVIGGWLFLASGSTWMLIREYSNLKSIQSSSIMSSWFEILMVIGMIALFAYIRSDPEAQAKVLPGAAWRNVFGHSMLFLLGFCTFVGSLPGMLAGLTTSLGILLFDGSCLSPTIRDVAWLVLDNLVKGALLDIMESFHIDFFTCPVNCQSWAASTIVFSVRLLSTLSVGLVHWSSMETVQKPDAVIASLGACSKTYESDEIGCDFCCPSAMNSRG